MRIAPIALFALVIFTALATAIEIASWRSYHRECRGAGHLPAKCEAAYRKALDAPVVAPRLPGQ